MRVILGVTVDVVMCMVIAMHDALLSCQVLINWREKVQYIACGLVFCKISWFSELN